MKKAICIVYIFLFTSISYANAQYWHNQKRTLRYHPDGSDFVITHGNLKYNRALYSRLHTGFRIETGDLPEFGLYLPNMGGNLHFGLWCKKQTKWLNNAQFIEARYRAGSRIYIIRDSLLGKGTVRMTILPLSDKDGMILQFTFHHTPKGLHLLTVFGGASNRRFLRDGDLGVDPKNSFDLHAINCKDNKFTIQQNRFQLLLPPSKQGDNTFLYGIFPKNSLLKIGRFSKEATPFQLWHKKGIAKDSVLLSQIAPKANKTYYFLIQKGRAVVSNDCSLKQRFKAAENSRQQLASRIRIATPDPYINTLGGTLSIAADAIWGNRAYLHGAVGWRMPLPGWRGPYAGDVLGWHNRARTHFNSYAASQVVDIPPSLPSPALDSAMHLSRGVEKWGTPIYSNGYICRNPDNNHQMNHYDMNLCYMDELLWHFNWTGNWSYVKKMWPVIRLSLAWEKRNFDPQNNGLYDAYAAIWASDGLQYNSGGVTHAMAYNYRANVIAAEIAKGTGKNPVPYQKEADKIKQALSTQLWLSKKGWWAEYKDYMGYKRLHTEPAVWTIYQAIDDQAGTPFQFYQATRYLDTKIPHIPVLATGLHSHRYSTIATSDWMPYDWSINNVAHAEVMNTALAYWESGRNNSAFNLFKSDILDEMYLGASPGNFGQISFYDAARGECYRDFADNIGITSRAIIQGLFGIWPDALNHKAILKPGFPDTWKFTSLNTPDISLSFKQNHDTTKYVIKQHFPEKLNIQLHLRACADSILSVTINGVPTIWQADTATVGVPCVNLLCGNDSLLNIHIIWGKNHFRPMEYTNEAAYGDIWYLKTRQHIDKIYDPQGIFSQLQYNTHLLRGKIIGITGFHTFFVKLSQGEMTWWQPVNIEIKQPVEVVPVNTDRLKLRFFIVNNRNMPTKGRISINHNNQYMIPFSLQPHSKSGLIVIPDSIALCGTNEIDITTDQGIAYPMSMINWDIKNRPVRVYQPVNMDAIMNDKVTQIFRNHYLSPRSPYTTLQLPWQGMGEWCHPLDSAMIDDSGLRKAVVHNLFHTSLGISFRTFANPAKNNIAFTSLWNNYPDQITVPLHGKASHAYFLMAGSTNYMQSHFVNGIIRITYTDGTKDSLLLSNPDSWCPIEQDYYTDGYAFKLNQPRPYRVYLKTGIISRQLIRQDIKNMKYDTKLSKKKNGGDYIETPPTEVSNRRIDGGAAVILDMPLNQHKALKSLTLQTVANDVVIGLMGITLMQ
ncbi:DUF4450 domain-containing protein [Microbacter margulisiae]|uniref:DUF4450 domain-containing protein n=1 Tax=Microbacter margulisiae TaxID=1350067 RepID=A0A7W5DQ93_9PORP|nr:DUF4450 domain-containing protein [Microbacter margulisiae]MBB3186976.1 hypothetical protein [Microbacter margulisiae]